MYSPRFFLQIFMLILVPTFPLAGQDAVAEVSAGAGKTYQVSSLTFATDSLSFDVGGENLKLDTDTIQSVTFPTVPLEKENGIVAKLADGTSVTGVDFSVGENFATIEQASGQAVNFRLQDLRLVRLQKLTQEQMTAWNAISESVANSDLLVAIQRSEALTKIEGLILGIEDRQISFDFNSQQISVPFERAAGLRFFSSQSSSAKARLKAVVTDKFGSSWHAQALTGGPGQKVKLLLVCGSDVSLERQDIVKIDYSYGSSKYLAELETLSNETALAFDFPVSIAFDSLLGVRAIEGSQMSSNTPGPSLEFVGDGVATYRVPEGFTRFMGSVQLNPTGDFISPCRVRIELENEVIWEEKLSSSRQPASFDIPIAADQRLRLSVQASEEHPTGNTVFWHAPRLLR